MAQSREGQVGYLEWMSSKAFWGSGIWAVILLLRECQSQDYQAAELSRKGKDQWKCLSGGRNKLGDWKRKTSVTDLIKIGHHVPVSSTRLQVSVGWGSVSLSLRFIVQNHTLKLCWAVNSFGKNLMSSLLLPAHPHYKNTHLHSSWVEMTAFFL